MLIFPCPRRHYLRGGLPCLVVRALAHPVRPLCLCGRRKPARAKTSGIDVVRVRFAVYVICGGLAGVAGMLLAARTGSALTQAGIGYELDAIAAVVIGGVSLSGGVGRVTGTLIGALIIGVMNNGLDLMGIRILLPAGAEGDADRRRCDARSEGKSGRVTRGEGRRGNARRSVGRRKAQSR